MKNIGGLNQFSAAANLTLSQRQKSKYIQNQNKEGLKKRKSLVQKVSPWQGQLIPSQKYI